MKILVIGYGSIGKRHAANAKSLGCDVVLLRHAKSNPNAEGFKEFYSFGEAVASIDGAIVCSPTPQHLNDVIKLVERKIPFLLEKPPATDYKMTLQMQEILKKNAFNRYEIGFNMRHYPPLPFIKGFLPQMGKVYAVRVVVGYYLPNWRKGVDYRQTSSASKKLGGGVHIEMVHEIDYLLWFFGVPESASAYVGKVSSLEIDTDDICAAILKYSGGPIAELHLDYLSHKYLRGCQIIAENGTLEWEMKAGRVLFTTKGEENPQEVFSLKPDYDFNETYLEELKAFFNIINGDNKSQKDIVHALDTMRVLEAINRSSAKEKWIYLKDI